MNKAERLKLLIDSGKTVWTPQELQLLWNEEQFNVKINAIRMVEKGLLIRPAKGYYALNEKYSVYELANKIIIPHIFLSILL